MEEFVNVRKVLASFSDTVEDLYQKKLLDNDVIATGNLVDSVAVTYRQKGSWFEVLIRLEDYWKNIEYGRRPNSMFPPVDQILQWVQIKPIIPIQDSLGRIPSEKSLAFLIGRKIASDGIKAKPYLTETVEQALKKFELELIQALQADIEDFTGTFIRNILGQNDYKFLIVR